VLIAEINADRPIPPVDLVATQPAGLYSLSDIVSDAELSLIDAEAIYALPDESARLAAIPYKYCLHYQSNYRNSRFINERLKTLFAQEAPDHKRLRMIFYAALLMAFFKHNKMASKRGVLKGLLGPIPNPLLDGLLSRYTEDQLTSTQEDAKKRYPVATTTKSDLSVPTGVRIKWCVIYLCCVS
jgi:hypothetical protein